MNKVFLLGFILFLAIAGAHASPGRSAYILHYTQDKSYLDHFETDNDTLAEKILIPEDSGYNNFVVDENGGCYIAEFRYSWDYGQNIYYYNPQSKKIEAFIGLTDVFGPRYMVLTKDELIVEVRGGKEMGKSGIIFIDRKTRKITAQVFLQSGNPRYLQANIDDIYYDGAKYLFLSSLYVERNSSPYFSDSEFKDGKTINELCREIGAVVSLSLKKPNNTVNRLNEILMTNNLYDVWARVDRALVLTGKIRELIEATKDNRSKQPDEVFGPDKMDICLLNRLLIEANFPNDCPKGQTQRDWAIKDTQGDIYMIDIKKKEIAKTITVPREYKFVDGIVNVGDKIYVAALGKGERNYKINMGDTPTNEELLAFSLKTGELIKKIKVSGHPWKLIYDRSVNKLYVQHMDDREPRSTVEVIDPTTDKIIDRLNIPSTLMFSLAKPGKMYITVGEMMLTPSRTKPGLLVLDTATDKIVKRIDGDFKGISDKSFVQ